MPFSESESQESEYIETRIKSQKTLQKKRKRPIKDTRDVESLAEFPVQALFSVLRLDYANEEDTFEKLIAPLLEDFIRARDDLEKDSTELDENGNATRPLRLSEISSFTENISKKPELSHLEAIALRKLGVDKQRRVARAGQPNIAVLNSSLTPLPSDLLEHHINSQVLDALYNIQSTPFESSFLARLEGTREHLPLGLISVDWETRTPWMNLMADIREHYTFAHPERNSSTESIAPITYSTLHPYHLPQVHDLLERSFWAGIDVTDALDYMPERTTMVAMYKKVVVGVAIIMSPIQTYITYLAVKAGWDKAQIARTMLFHLISMHPDKDFTLHVSTNSSAMLLYNQFGFKAEEFVAGFYSSYLGSNSRASKNAFKLRLRHI